MQQARVLVLISQIVSSCIRLENYQTITGPRGLTLSWVTAYMSHTGACMSHNSIGDGKDLEFYKSLSLLHQVCAKHPTIYIANAHVKCSKH